jgi:hypothetical protein
MPYDRGLQPLLAQRPHFNGKRFAGHIHVLQSKVCILLQNMRTNIYLHKHAYDSFILFIYLWFTIYFYYYYLLIPPTLKTFPTVALQYLLRR